MRFPIRTAAGLSAVMLALNLGCGGGDTLEEPAGMESASSEPSGSADVCGLLTVAEIEEVMGQAPGEPHSEDVGTCQWPAPGGEGPMVFLTLAPTTLSSYDAFVLQYQREFGGEEPPREYYAPVEGVGDWAMYLKDESALQVFVGDRMLQVTTQPAGQERAVALAEKALPRLGQSIN